jgi:type II secretory pathway predicted ATPase ExeA
VYEAFFGFKQKPFSLLPDPRFLYGSRTHKIAVSLLEYGLAEQAGYVVLTGEVGTGKTTLLRHLLHTVRNEVVVGLVTNTHHAFGELMKWILLAFDLDFRGKDQVEQHQIFVDHLIRRYAEGRRVVLIVDEAQNLAGETLEQLRMLSNVNSEADHLLQLILVGQPELRALLMRPELRQFVQRIAVDYHLQPLQVDDTTSYIRHRIGIAGGNPYLFDEEACAAVHFFARGIPRLINALADYALVFAFADDRVRIDLDTVIDAAAERMSGGLGAFERPAEELTREQLKARILGGAGR